MADTAPFLKLTVEGAQKMVAAAAAKAKEIGQPQCITIVDTGGHMIAFLRMDGAYVQSIDSSMRKAMTSASYGTPTGHIPEGPDIRLAIATDGKRINLPGGLPIIVDGHVVGAIGIGSGTGAQDLECAKAAIATLEGAQQF
jgi:glc operon protein GlcG